MKKTSHGLSSHPLYRVWKGMKQRCDNPRNSAYERYGRKGIKVCREWQEDFQNFFNDMAQGYSRGLQLDRIDNTKGYCKENCRWVTPAVNVRNRGNTIFYQGVCLKDYCRHHGLKYNTVMGRLRQYHWNIEQAVLEGNYRGKRGMNHGK